MKINVTKDPKRMGFDPKRLDRIGEHFQSYVEQKKLAGWLVSITRHSEPIYLAKSGLRDIEGGLPIEEDTLFRIYSMTKPITTVAAMILYERGLLDITDPVSKYIPSFANLRVFKQGSTQAPLTVPATEPMRIWHLMTHTSGLTYGFHHAHTTDAIYRANGYEWGWPPDVDLAGACDTWASMPLVANPGTEWNYSVSTDVLGRVVEVASGMRLDEFMKKEIFDPLSMVDTSFYIEPERASRLAALYMPGANGEITRLDAFGNACLSPQRVLSGGGGLVSTASDYAAFMAMMLNRGELDRVRILAPKTVDYMVTNHLPGNQDMDQIGRPIFSESNSAGVGFGLGFSVVINPADTKSLISKGTYAWGGAASTAFFIDPKEGLAISFMTQLLPSSTYPIRPELVQLVYSAMVD